MHGWYNDYSRESAIFPTNYENYVDLGATCYDKADGDLTAVIVTNMTKTFIPCKPSIVSDYKCVDSSGNAAEPAARTVLFPPPLPNCTVRIGPGTVEASFPYHDVGAACVSGAFPTEPEIWANDTQYANANEIVNVEQTGEYTITYRARNLCDEYDTDPLANYLFWRLHANNRCGDVECWLTRTVKVIDTLKPILVLSDTGSTSTILQHTAPVGGTGVETSAVTGSSLQWNDGGGSLQPVGVRVVATAGGASGLDPTANRRRLIGLREPAAESSTANFLMVATMLVAVGIAVTKARRRGVRSADISQLEITML
jgi:hypothetical protein